MKLDDIELEIRSIKNEMPLFDDFSARVPISQFGMNIKNLEKHTQKVNEKYLNKHLGIIEEISKQFPDHLLPKWMKQYQNRYFKADIIRDGFFRNSIQADLSDIRQIGRQHNNPKISFGLVTSTLDNGFTGSGSSGWLGSVEVIKWTGLVVGGSITNSSPYITVAAGNCRIKCYQDDGAAGAPSTLLGEGNSTAISGTGFQSGLSYISPAIVPASGNVYTGQEFDSNTTAMDRDLTAGSGYRSPAHTYGTGPSPFGSGTNISYRIRQQLIYTHA